MTLGGRNKGSNGAVVTGEMKFVAALLLHVHKEGLKRMMEDAVGRVVLIAMRSMY